jgi:phospholipid/cholesterol/gamma-HCH transport system substrate-binding protein
MTEPRPGRLTRRLRGAAAAVAATLLLSGCEFSVYDIPLPGGADTGENPYTVTVEFRDVLDLVPQSAVKVDDVTVGSVEDVQLRGYVARVDLILHEDVELPANARAEIRQTSLLGEKFVALEQPTDRPSSQPLEDGAVIPVTRSGRNVEVEEVLGALSLLLNGGGVGQLKSITKETNTVLGGRTSTIKSSLRQLRTFMAQLDGSKFEILRALENVNELSKSLNANKETLDLALDELPSAIESIDSQREDLVTMLRALADLSSVGTRVIRASKEGTIRSLNALAPILRELARAGDAVPRSIQLLLTFPFVDAVVGKSPQEARDLHMGDYTNLSMDLRLNARDLARFLLDEIETVTGARGRLCEVLDLPALCDPDGGGIIDPADPLGPDGPLDGILGNRDRGKGGRDGGARVPGGNGGLLGLGRAAPASGELTRADIDAAAERAGVDLELAGLLAWGAVPR